MLLVQSVFAGTGMDPDPKVRKRIAAKAAKKLKKKKSSSESSSTGSSSDSYDEESGELFEETQKVRRIGRLAPGALTTGHVATASSMQPEGSGINQKDMPGHERTGDRGAIPRGTDFELVPGLLMQAAWPRRQMRQLVNLAEDRAGALGKANHFKQSRSQRGHQRIKRREPRQGRSKQGERQERLVRKLARNAMASGKREAQGWQRKAQKRKGKGPEQEARLLKQGADRMGEKGSDPEEGTSRFRCMAAWSGQ